MVRRPLLRFLSKLPKFEDDNLIVGIETSDDAAIYKVTDDIAMIQTVDFFTPIVDDPYMFGQIAAATRSVMCGRWEESRQ